VIDFAVTKFQVEVEFENKMLKKKEEEKKTNSASSDSSAGDLSGDSDYDDISTHEKKLNVLYIPHILMWKIINDQRADLEEGSLQGPDALLFALNSSKKFIFVATQYFIMQPTVKSMSSSSSFVTHLITYLNRIIVVNKEWFMQEVL